MQQLSLAEIKQKAMPILKQAGVIKSSVFGSYVRGEQKEESDIDILIELPRGKTLIDLVGIKQDLEETLKKSVDVVTYNSIHPLLKESILKDQYPVI